MKSLEPITQRILQHVRSNKTSLTVACRQSGKTESMIRYAIEKAIEKKTTITIVVKSWIHVKTIQSIIFNKRPDISILNVGSIVFPNESRIRIVGSQSCRGNVSEVNLFDDIAHYQNPCSCLSFDESTENHYFTSYNPRNIAFFDVVKNVPSLNIQWRDLPYTDEKWLNQIMVYMTPHDFFNDYCNGSK